MLAQTSQKNHQEFRLHGLVAATHTPLHADGSLDLDKIPSQAAILNRQGLTGAFIGGSTGEGVSLTIFERKRLAEAWETTAPENNLKLIVHVGHTSSAEAAELASHAADHGADAISTMAPFYFKPTTVKPLIEWLKPVAKACENLPFYFYDIPVMTGVRVNLLEFVNQACQEIPNFHGIKYTSDDLIQLQELLHFDQGRLDILYGTDEALLASLALGVKGAVGSSYNFAAPLYLQIIEAFQTNDFAEAQRLQLQSVQLIRKIASFGYLPAAKAVMGLLGCDCGPARPPLINLASEDKQRLLAEVRALNLIPGI
jgi:N-acetylneuraminate lyase